MEIKLRASGGHLSEKAENLVKFEFTNFLRHHERFLVDKNDLRFGVDRTLPFMGLREIKRLISAVFASPSLFYPEDGIQFALGLYICFLTAVRPEALMLSSKEFLKDSRDLHCLTWKDTEFCKDLNSPLWAVVLQKIYLDILDSVFILN